jgi:hypothetical protein
MANIQNSKGGCDRVLAVALEIEQAALEKVLIIN